MMADFKGQFKKDFEESSPQELGFDLAQLEPNRKKNVWGYSYRHKIKPVRLGLVIAISAVVALVAVPSSIFLFSMLRTVESVNTYKGRYAVNEIRIAESNTFKKLNVVTYPEGTDPLPTKLTEAEDNAYNDFSSRTYHALVDSSKKDNMSYSVMGLYSVLNEMVPAISREELKTRFDALLGLDQKGRESFYEKVIKANSFAREESTTQLKNAAFFNHEFHYNQDYVKSLMRLYCEAYQIDFAAEANKMVEWGNKAVYSNGFIDEKFLEMDEETQLYLFSTLYFKNAWSSKYLAENNREDDFFLDGVNSVRTTFMQHSFFTDAYYDYGTYVSFQDHYFRGNATVTYLVPKKVEDNIYDLTKEANIFEEKEENKITPTEKYGRINIHLTTPKFVSRCDVDFRTCLQHLGFHDIFDRTIDSFKNAFDDEKLIGYKTYVQKLKQRNEVEFNEDGSIVKSITFASLGAGSAAPIKVDALDVKLNQPFIYIIRDINGTPIFVGHMDNPTLK